MPKITLRAARVNAGLTQEQMAQRLGVTKRRVLDWETGKAKIRPGYVHAYSNITGFPVDSFLLPEEYLLKGSISDNKD